MKYAYSPDTGEIIHITPPKGWMGATDVAPPVYDTATAGCFWRGSSWEIVRATPDLIKLKGEAHVIIDSVAGSVRARYITIAPGQESTYLIKAQQAAEFKAGGYSGQIPGLVQAEVSATGATAKQAADAILTMQAEWVAIAAQIESARRRGKVTVTNAQSVIEIDEARDSAIAELSLI